MIQVYGIDRSAILEKQLGNLILPKITCQVQGAHMRIPLLQAANLGQEHHKLVLAELVRFNEGNHHPLQAKTVSS